MSGQRLGSEAVVDASVVVKFLIQESDSDKADALFERFLDGKFRLLAPDLCALRRAGRRQTQDVRSTRAKFRPQPGQGWGPHR